MQFAMEYFGFIDKNEQNTKFVFKTATTPYD